MHLIHVCFPACFCCVPKLLYLLAVCIFSHIRDAPLKTVELCLSFFEYCCSTEVGNELLFSPNQGWTFFLKKLPTPPGYLWCAPKGILSDIHMISFMNVQWKYYILKSIQVYLCQISATYSITKLANEILNLHIILFWILLYIQWWIVAF